MRSKHHCYLRLVDKPQFDEMEGRYAHTYAIEVVNGMDSGVRGRNQDGLSGFHLQQEEAHPKFTQS
jgi:hypothetical protein